MTDRQLGLFAEPRAWGPETVALAQRLSDNIHLGTSSWTFPGWSGLCYPRGTTDARLQRDGLSLYANYPLFRTVGIDRSLYRPLARDTLAAYAAQLPDGFRCVEKVWDRVTSAKSPDFLDPALFADVVHEPHVGTFDDHLACYVLELAPMPRGLLTPDAFAEKMAQFLDAAPPGTRYAVELRNPEWLTPRYLRVLADHGAAHVYNQWTHMPTVGEQRAMAAPTTDFMIARLLLRPGTRYEDRKAAFTPFDRLQDVDETLRDDVVALAEEAAKTGRTLRVIVNNKAEGSAPLTVKALAERIVARLAR